MLYEELIKKPNKIEGQAANIKRIINANKYYTHILIQLNSAQSAIQKISQVNLEAQADHSLMHVSDGSDLMREIEMRKRVALYAVKYGVIVLSILGIGLFFGTPYIAPWFTIDAEAINQIVIALKIDAFNQPGLAISLILAGVLQGMRDTKTPLYSTAFGMWITRILGVILLGSIMGLGIAGVWLAIGLDLYVRSLFLTYHFKRNLQILNSNNELSS